MSIPDLKAKPGCCEEASPLSHQFYIPCNRPAVAMIKLRDPQPYRMCEWCADHNIRNRGGTRVGDYDASYEQQLAEALAQEPIDPEEDMNP